MSLISSSVACRPISSQIRKSADRNLPWLLRSLSWVLVAHVCFFQCDCAAYFLLKHCRRHHGVIELYGDKSSGKLVSGDNIYLQSFTCFGLRSRWQIFTLPYLLSSGDMRTGLGYQYAGIVAPSQWNQRNALST